MARRERNIYWRGKEKRYEARYIKGRDESGKAQYGAVYAKTYGEVKERRDEKLVALKLVKPPIVGTANMVGAVLAAYLTDMKGRVKPSTYNIYDHYLTAYISPKIGHERCNSLSFETLQNLIDELYESGLSAVTVQSKETNLPADVFKVRLPKTMAKEIDVLTRDEQRRLEAAARDSDDINRVAVTLMLYTGLRVGECMAVRWDDIDLERQCLHVRRTLQRIKNVDPEESLSKTSVTCLSPKTESSERTIPLPGFLIPMLGEHKSINRDGYVVSRDGHPVEPRCMQMRFRKLLAAADIRSMRLHSLRHTFSTRVLESGGDITTLSALLGHANVGITISTYAHSLEEQKRRSIEALAAVYQ